MADEAQCLVIVTERIERRRRRDSSEGEGPEPALMMLVRTSGRPERVNRSGGACTRSVPECVAGSAKGWCDLHMGAEVWRSILQFSLMHNNRHLKESQRMCGRDLSDFKRAR